MFKYRVSLIIFFITEALMAVLFFSGELTVLPLIIGALIYIFVLSYFSFNMKPGFYLKTICRGGTDRKEVAITFDDGPLTMYTPRILDILKEKSVPAVFFCTGEAIVKSRDIAKRIAMEGHGLGNHTWSHSPWFGFYSVSKMEDQLVRTGEIIKSITGAEPIFFRPPFGVTNPNLSRAVKSFRFHVIGWTFRTYDTTINDRRKLIDRTVAGLVNGAILTFHDYREITVDILPELIDSIRNRGYRIVALNNLIEERLYE